VRGVSVKIAREKKRSFYFFKSQCFRNDFCSIAKLIARENKRDGSA
jgi:hypothetical protein